MTIQKKLIIANFKMHPRTPKEVEKLVLSIAREVRTVGKKADIVIAPPFPFLSIVTKRSKILLGSQDVFWEDPIDGGAFTGAISAGQLKSLNVSYVIVGHSERRRMGETNDIVSKKLRAVLGRGMKAVLCVGEEERMHDVAFPPLVRDELRVLKTVKSQLLKNIVIAYEPIWAISSQKGSSADTPQNVYEMSTLIRRELYQMLGKKSAMTMPIIYGGSVNDVNAAKFVSEGNVDGVLVGSASLKARVFGKIARNVAIA